MIPIPINPYVFLILVGFSILGMFVTYKALSTFFQNSIKNIKLKINTFKTQKINAKIEKNNLNINTLENKIFRLNSILQELKAYDFILNRFVAVDVETTGLKAAECNIIQISFVLFLNGEPKHMYCKYINPGKPLPPQCYKGK